MMSENKKRQKEYLFIPILIAVCLILFFLIFGFTEFAARQIIGKAPLRAMLSSYAS
jgi:hypothetical protein